MWKSTELYCYIVAIIYNSPLQGLKGYQGLPGPPGRKGLPVSLQQMGKKTLGYHVCSNNANSFLSVAIPGCRAFPSFLLHLIWVE